MLGSTLGFVAFCCMVAVCVGLLTTAVVQIVSAWQTRQTGEAGGHFGESGFTGRNTKSG